MFSLKSRKKFLVSLRVCSLENLNYFKLRTYLHTRTRELKKNAERYDVAFVAAVSFAFPNAREREENCEEWQNKQ